MFWKIFFFSLLPPCFFQVFFSNKNTMPSAFSHSTWKFRFPPFLITEFSESTFSFTEISRGFSVHTEFSRSTFSQNRNFRDPPFLTQKFQRNLPSLTYRNFWRPLFLIQNFLYPPSPILEISRDSLCPFWHPRQNLVFCLIPHTTQNRPGPLFVHPLFVFKHSESLYVWSFFRPM